MGLKIEKQVELLELGPGVHAHDVERESQVSSRQAADLHRDQGSKSLAARSMRRS
jgi:hypothetical protein